MSSTSYNSGFSTGVNPSGIWRAYVKSVDGHYLSITIPRLGNDNIYREVPYTGGVPVIGQSVLVGFIEGKSNLPVAFVGVDFVDDLHVLGDLQVDKSTVLNGGLSVSNDTSIVGNLGTGGNVDVGGNVNVGGNIDVVGYVHGDSFHFDIDAAAVAGEGQMAWNDEEGTIDIGMHGGDVVLEVGQETVYYARNKQTYTITKGTVVRFDSNIGNSGRITVDKFLANKSYPSTYLMGVAAEDILPDEDGYVTHFGRVRGISTDGSAVGEGPGSVVNGWEPGTLLYASPTTAGALTSIKPTAPNNIVLIAAVISSHASNGTIFVRPTFVADLLDNERVNAPSIVDGDVLVYNGTAGVFENVSFTSAAAALEYDVRKLYVMSYMGM